MWVFFERDRRPTPIVSQNKDHMIPFGVAGEVFEDRLPESVVRGMDVDGKSAIGAVGVPVRLDYGDVELLGDHSH